MIEKTDERCDLCGTSHPNPFKVNEAQGFLPSFDTGTLATDSTSPIFTMEEMRVLSMLAQHGLISGQRDVARKTTVTIGEGRALKVLASLVSKLNEETNHMLSGGGGLFRTPF